MFYYLRYSYNFSYFFYIQILLKPYFTINRKFKKVYFNLAIKTSYKSFYNLIANLLHFITL